MDINFHEGYHYTIEVGHSPALVYVEGDFACYLRCQLVVNEIQEETGNPVFFGSDVTEGVIYYSQTIIDMYEKGECYESFTFRSFLGLESFEGYPFFDNLKCHSKHGVGSLSRNLLCGQDGMADLIALLQVGWRPTQNQRMSKPCVCVFPLGDIYIYIFENNMYTKLLCLRQGYSGRPCSNGPDERTCVHIETYVALVLDGDNACGVDYLVMVIFETSENGIKLQFIPTSLYPDKCRTYYYFAQVGSYIKAFD